MNLLEIFLGQIPEALYFAIFMLLVKELKEKRVVFVVLMTLEYILLFNILPFSIWAHILYFILSFILMQIIYKDKSNITDVFTLGIASLSLIPIGIISYFIAFGNMMLGNIFNKILMFVLLILFRRQLPKIKNLYLKLWNRSKRKYKMKSTTFRALNVVVFNLSFVIINLGLIITSVIRNINT